MRNPDIGMLPPNGKDDRYAVRALEN